MPTRILIIGLGSIGMRHARLLREHFPDVALTALRSGLGRTDNELGMAEILDWSDVPVGSFEVAIIANPTNLHIQTALECARRGMHLFLEKPIDCSLAGLDELIGLTQQQRLSTYVAYPLRFHPVIRTLRQRLAGRAVRHASMVCASYLPDWRPGRDHRQIYSAHAQLGGGVLLDMSHELDLSEHLFGPVRSVEGTLRRVADVTVDAEDSADVLLAHEWGTCNIHLNTFSRQPRRAIEVETADGFLVADIRGQTVLDLHDGVTQELRVSAEPDGMYLAQLRHFLSNLGRTDLDNNLPHASDLYRKMIAFREEEGYGAVDHDLRSRRVRRGEGEEHPPRARQTPDRLHD